MSQKDYDLNLRFGMKPFKSMRLPKLFSLFIFFILISFSCEDQTEINVTPKSHPDFVPISQVTDLSPFVRLQLDQLLTQGYSQESVFYYSGTEKSAWQKAGQLGGRAFSDGFLQQLTVGNEDEPGKSGINARYRCHDNVWEESYRDGQGNLQWRLAAYECPEYDNSRPAYVGTFYDLGDLDSFEQGDGGGGGAGSSSGGSYYTGSGNLSGEGPVAVIELSISEEKALVFRDVEVMTALREVLADPEIAALQISLVNDVSDPLITKWYNLFKKYGTRLATALVKQDIMLIFGDNPDKEKIMIAIHTILDGAGFFPIAGEVADGINGIIYIAEEDYFNATLSGISLAVPVAGDMVGKGVKLVLGLIENASPAGRATVELFKKAGFGQMRDFVVKLAALPMDQFTKLLNDALANHSLLGDILTNPRLVDAWKKLDDLGDIALNQLRKDSDFLKKFDEVVNDVDLNKHLFEGEPEVVDGLLRKVSGVHSNKNLIPTSQTSGISRGDVRIQPGSKVDLGNGYYEAKVQIYGDKGAPGGTYVDGWVKGKKSTFFPDGWSVEKTQAEIARGVKLKVPDPDFAISNGNTAFKAVMTDGTKLQLLYDGEKLVSAFPNFK